MFFPDLAAECEVDQGPYVRAVGWLDGSHPFSRGPVPRDVLRAILEHVENAWEPVVAAGCHACEVCGRMGDEPALGRGNVWIPAAEVVYVAPELIVHYIQVHSYRPPDEFMSAALACPPQGSPEYQSVMRRFDAWWVPYLENRLTR